MNYQENCPECGSLSDGSTEGLCHKCLLAAAIYDTMDRNLRIRCPHCNNPVEIIDESEHEVTCPSCHSSFGFAGTTSQSVPQQLGRFQLGSALGTGSFGTVYRAYDPELERDVAIKIPRQREDADLFLKEAKSAARLNHPNIVSVHEVGQDGQVFFIVADLVEGKDLAIWLAEHQPSFGESVAFCRKIAAALDHGHQSGVVHRDLKPANILLAHASTDVDDSTEGLLGSYEPKVTDFGLAKRETGEITMTAPGKMLGTPAYMSPEQAAGDGFQADARSDVYSLGVILFELLTGEKPFRGNLQMLLKQVQDEDPPRLRQLNNRIPADLETITLKCLEKRPDSRYQSAAELEEELRRFEEGKPVQARPISMVERGWRSCRRNPVTAGLATLAAFLLLCVAGVSTIGYWNQIQKTNDLERAKYSSDMTLGFAQAESSLQGTLVKQTLRNSHPQIAKQDRRGWEWFLLNSYLHRELAVLRGHKTTAEDVDWSSDGSLLTSVGGEGDIVIWDGNKHTAIHTIENAHKGVIWCVSWRPNQKTFATGGADGFARLWDADGNEIAKFFHEMPSEDDPTGLKPAPVRHLVWRANDGMLITGDDSCTATFWDVDQGKKAKTLSVKEYSKFTNGVLGIDWSNKYGLVTAADRAGSSQHCSIRLWDQAEPMLEEFVADNESDKHFVAWQPAGDLLALGGKRNRVVVWNNETNEVEHTLHARHYLLDGAWHGEEPLLAVCGNDGAVRVWDHGAKEERVFIGHGSPVLGVAWRPKTRRLASAGQDGCIRIWSMDTPKLVQEYKAEESAWNSDGSKLACIVGQEIHILDMETHHVRVLEDRLNEPVGMRTICWSPDDTWIATSDFPEVAKAEGNNLNFILIWDVATGRHTKKISHDRIGWQMNNLQWHPKADKLLYHNQQTRIFDLETGSILREVEGKNGLMSAFSPDGTRVLTMVSDGSTDSFGYISVWDAATGKEELKLEHRAFGAQWDPTGNYIAAACPDRSARLFDASTGKLTRTMRGHDGWVTAVAWTPDGKRLATMGDRGVAKIWDPWTGQEIVTFESNTANINLIRGGGVRFSPDGKKLAILGFFGAYSIGILDASKGYDNADTPVTYDPDEQPIIRSF